MDYSRIAPAEFLNDMVILRGQKEKEDNECWICWIQDHGNAELNMILPRQVDLRQTPWAASWFWPVSNTTNGTKKAEPENSSTYNQVPKKCTIG